MKRHVNVLGVGMTQFKTPNNADPYTVMGHAAGQLALADAGLGYDMPRAAAQKVYEDAGSGPEDVKVVELHDCFSSNEVLSYEALGRTAPGTAERMIEAGERQVEGARIALQHNIGLGGCCVVTLYERTA